jgi:hypothetical protein
LAAASITPRSEVLPIMMLTFGVMMRIYFKVFKLFCFFAN